MSRGAEWSRDGFTAFLKEQRGGNYDSRARTFRRVAKLVELGLDIKGFAADPAFAQQEGNRVLAAISTCVSHQALTQYRVSLNAAAQYLGVDVHFRAPNKGRPPRPVPKESEVIVKRLRKYAQITLGLEPITARGHERRIRYLVSTCNLDLVEFVQDDLSAQECAEEALMLRSEHVGSNDTYNKDVLSLRYLAKAHDLDIDLAERHSQYRLNPDAATTPQLQMFLRWEGDSREETHTGRALATWFLFSTKRRRESSLVDYNDWDVVLKDLVPGTEAKDEFVDVRMRKPGKMGRFHVVMIPVQTMRPRRALGAQYRWRGALRNDPKVYIEGDRPDAFWLMRVPSGRGIKRYRPMTGTDMGKLINRMSRETGIRMTSTRLRKTGISIIANGAETDVLDANIQADHSKVDHTKKYVTRDPSQRRKRLAGAQKDIHQRK